LQNRPADARAFFADHPTAEAKSPGYEVGGMRVFPKCNARISVVIIIQAILYSQRAVGLKTVEIYCDFCREDLVF
jgi:hypothetical protein